MKSIITALFISLSFATFGQTLIGYTNVELILAYMPETRSMESTMQTYQKKKGDQLKVKDDYLKLKYEEYLVTKENGARPDQLKPLEAELTKLDGELKKFANEADNDIVMKQQELLEPILAKLQDALDAVALDRGLTYILNQTTSAGVSTILFGPVEYDVTEDVFKKLNISIPNE